MSVSEGLGIVGGGGREGEGRARICCTERGGEGLAPTAAVSGVPRSQARICCTERGGRAWGLEGRGLEGSINTRKCRQGSASLRGRRGCRVKVFFGSRV